MKKLHAAVFRRFCTVLCVGAAVVALTAGCVDSSEQAGGCTPPEVFDTVPTAGPEGPKATGPEVASGFRKGLRPVSVKNFGVATANPYASWAGCEVLNSGGSAIDAAVAIQTVLGLVEPQSSGLGGGAFLLHYDAETGVLDTYDGRETAPLAATDTYLTFVDGPNSAKVSPTLRESGRSIGVPGVMRLLEMAHNEHGKQAWSGLYNHAATLAHDGFSISARMAASVNEFRDSIARQPDAAAYFLNPDGSPKPAGTLLTNLEYETTLKTLASGGADAFYNGALASSIVEAANSDVGDVTPAKLSTADLAQYHAVKRAPVCAPYRIYEVCGMAPPSSGGITVASTLGILDSFPMSNYPPDDKPLNGGFLHAEGVHLITEAERLSYADRDAYIADTDFQALPGGSPETLLDPEYLHERAALINPAQSMGTAQAGRFDDNSRGRSTPVEHGTSHITIADKEGNVAVMTTSVESAFGSFHMTNGFLLNNQLGDFSPTAVDASGAPVANRIEPGKRPRSSMAPTLVFAQPDNTDVDNPQKPSEKRQLVLATGSPGGGTIIQYVVKTLVGILDWGMDPQEAISMIDFGAANSPTTNIGGEHPNVNVLDDGIHDPLVQGLRERGHRISLAPQSSGLSALMPYPHKPGDWIGAVDPRREGTVNGNDAQQWTRD